MFEIYTDRDVGFGTLKKCVEQQLYGKVHKNRSINYVHPRIIYCNMVIITI